MERASHHFRAWWGNWELRKSKWDIISLSIVMDICNGKSLKLDEKDNDLYHDLLCYLIS